MTTTAEDIEQMAKDIASLKATLEIIDSRLQRVAFRAKSEPPDPGPLECWVNVYPGSTESEVFNSEEVARDCGQVGTPTRVAVHMREVTSQMEQDAKDAARYQEVKKAQQRNNLLWRDLLDADSENWDEIIAKTTEGEP